MRTPSLIAIAVMLSGCIAAGSFVDTQDSEVVVDSQDSGVDTDVTLDPTAVCTAWNTARQSVQEGSWTGSASSCDPGDLVNPARTNVLIQVNLMRSLANLPPVTDSTSLNGSAQECAVIQHANGGLSHFPANDWSNGQCLGLSSGVSAAAQSNIASTRAVAAVDLYMVDFGSGNAPSMGHRRWILSNSLGPIGIGGTSEFSCLQVIGGSGSAGAEWTAWPPPGIVPVEAVNPPSISWTDIDENGWTLQSDSLRLNDSDVVVTVTRDGQPVAITQRSLLTGYGSRYAIGWTFDSVSTVTPGHSYHVEVTGSFTTVAYDVDITDCSGF